MRSRVQSTPNLMIVGLLSLALFEVNGFDSYENLFASAPPPPTYWTCCHGSFSLPPGQGNCQRNQDPVTMMYSCTNTTNCDANGEPVAPSWSPSTCTETIEDICCKVTPNDCKTCPLYFFKCQLGPTPIDGTPPDCYCSAIEAGIEGCTPADDCTEFAPGLNGCNGGGGELTLHFTGRRSVAA